MRLRDFTISILVMLSCGLHAQQIPYTNVDTFSMPSSIRAIEVLGDQRVWFAGSKGTYGYTNDGGTTWNIDSIQHPDAPGLQFRSIAATSSAIFLLSIGNPALLFRTGDQGKTWEIVYREDHEKVFYDAMDFWDDRHGIAMGDPVDGCLSVILTTDGGANWNKVGCEQLPPTMDGEAAFAASNSNIALYGSHAWLVTGGAEARVFHTPDLGKSWEVSNTPIVSGGQMTGIYTIDFYDENTGIIFGGDWNQKEQAVSNKAITTDGGQTWSLVSDGRGPGYRSCVRYIPKTDGRHIIAAGSPGMSLSMDGGLNWNALNDFASYTVRFAASGKVAWVAGGGFIGKMSWD